MSPLLTLAPDALASDNAEVVTENSTPTILQYATAPAPEPVWVINAGQVLPERIFGIDGAFAGPTWPPAGGRSFKSEVVIRIQLWLGLFLGGNTNPSTGAMKVAPACKTIVS